VTPPKAEQSYSEVTAPQNVTVYAVPKVVLYKADGTPLTRQIGYKA
jgi:hypothetical protein